MKVKKIIALTLSLGMILGLSACGSGNSGGDKNNASLKNGEDVVTLTFFDKNSGSKTFDDAVAKKIMDETGVKISVENPTGDPDEKLNLMLSGQNYPDIVLIGQGELVTRYIEAGALIALDEYLNEKCPNIVEMYGDTLKKTQHSDGHNYWLANWYGEDLDPSAGILMRKDYLTEIVGEERANSPEPFTQSEYKEILRKFRELHPEIDGKESIPLSVVSSSTGSFGGLKGMFGLKTYYENGDGSLQYWARDPQYLKSMLFMNELSTEGLLDKEWVINKQEQWQQKMSSGYVFSSFGAYWDTDTINTTLRSTVGEDAQFYCYKVVADNLKPEQTTYNGRSSLGWDAIGITKNCKNVEAALRVMDYLASEEGQYLLLWGIEGEHWTMEDGKHVPKQEVLNNLLSDFDTTSNETGIRKWTWFIKNGAGSDGTPYDLATKYQMPDTAAFANEVFGESDYWDTANYAGLEPAGSTTLGLQWQKIADVMSQNYSKIVDAKSQKEAISVYEKMMKEMDDAGLKECEAYITEQYQERMKLWDE